MQAVAAELPPRAVETEPAGTDAVGFGKNIDKTYDEVWKTEPGYCLWTMNKFLEMVRDGKEQDTQFQEGESRMKRLAQWIIAREKICEEHGPQYEQNDDMEMVEVPGTRSLKERVLTDGGDKPAKFYGIAAPEKRVCTSWAECKPLVHGVKGVMYRSFATREEAEAFVANPPERKTKPKEPKEPKEPKQPKEPKVSKKKTKAAESGDAAEKPKKKAKTSKPAAEKTPGEGPAEQQAEEQAETQEKTKAPRKRKTKTAASAESTAAVSEVGDSTSKKACPKEKSKAKAKAGGKLHASAKAKAKAKAAAKKAEAKAKASAKKAETKVVAKKADKNVDEKAKALKTVEPAGELSESILAEAEALGLATALKNLAARPEVINLKLPGEALLVTLRASHGLVNKAKSMLLDGSGPSTPPPKSSLQPEASISPEKDENSSSQYLQQVDELAAMLGEKKVQPQASEIQTSKAELGEAAKPDGLTDEQRKRVQENRERALAKKRMLSEQNVCAGGA
mmetsp:Transcript_100556/g.178565  ORF Transcript_100556/g.178565 Transcript_100556/m.178565 type:complete len:508 (-) Transcript_100556:128-1651(-)